MKQELERLRSQWHRLADLVGRHASGHARSCLLDAEPLEVSGHHVRIAFDPEFAAEKDEMLIPVNKRALMHVLSDELARPVSVQLEVLEQKEDLPSDHPVDLASSSPDTRPETIQASGTQDMSPTSREHWIKNTAVRLTLEMFSGDIVDIRV